MVGKITYYAVIDDTISSERPVGLVRRRAIDDTDGGGFRDEGLHKDMEWHHTPVIVEWEHANFADELEEVSEEAAQQIIEDLRERWSALS
ncbi:hypothetical protein [Nonomuraea sp. NPDC003754]